MTDEQEERHHTDAEYERIKALYDSVYNDWKVSREAFEKKITILEHERDELMAQCNELRAKLEPMERAWAMCQNTINDLRAELARLKEGDKP